MSLPFSIRCPGCGTKLKVKKSSLIGKRLACPKCQHKVLVKEPSTKEQQSQTQRAKPATIRRSKSTEEQPSSNTGKRKTNIIVGAVLLFIIVGGLGLWSFLKGDAQQQVAQNDPAAETQQSDSVASNSKNERVKSRPSRRSSKADGESSAKTNPRSTDSPINQTESKPPKNPSNQKAVGGAKPPPTTRGGNVFVAVGYGGRRMSSVDGKTWENETQWVENGGDDDNLLRGACYGNGLFVAVGGSQQTRIVTSRDGKTWEEPNVERIGWLGDVAFGNEHFVAVGNGGAYLRSRDGKTWTDHNRVKEKEQRWPRHFRKIVFGNGVFVAIGDQGRRTISKDGVEWTHDQSIDQSIAQSDIAFGGGRFVIVGQNSYVNSSTDGITWDQARGLSDEIRITAVGWDGSHFIAAARQTGYTSADGLNWSPLNLSTRLPSRMFAVGGRFIGTDWKSRMSTSADGVTWEFGQDDKKNAITDVAFGAVARREPVQVADRGSRKVGQNSKTNGKSPSVPGGAGEPRRPDESGSRRPTEKIPSKPRELASHQPIVDAESFNKTVRPFLQTHCFRCHGPKTQEGELRLDQLAGDFSQRHIAEKWTEVMDRMNKGEMPPEDEPRPNIQQQEQVVTWISRQLRRAIEAARSTGGRVVLRRINRAEYNNTIRDLIGIDFTPADDFPEDPPAHGFDNVGASLTVSPLHIEKYMRAARMIIDKAIVTGPRPTSQKWHFEVDEAAGFNEAGPGSKWLARKVNGRDRRYGILIAANNAVRDGLVVSRRVSWDTWLGFRFFEFPEAGEYIVRVRAASAVPSHQETVKQAMVMKRGEADIHVKGRKNQQQKDAARRWWDDEALPAAKKYFSEKPYYRYGPPRMKIVNQQSRTIIGEIDVDAPANKPQIYEFRATFPKARSGVVLTNNYSIPLEPENNALLRHPEFPRPELLVDWVELEGPIVDDWPLPSQQRILFPSKNKGNETEYAREVLGRFITRAFRRPATQEELDVALALFKQVRPNKESFEEAIKVPLIATLSNPHFLYLIEPAQNDGASARDLDNYELASRLSYFLWSSMPDEELLQLAAAGKLSDPAIVDAQIDRMLSDSKSTAFAKNFAGQWLGLRKVGANPPGRDWYPRYDDHLQESMVRESEGFFAEILHNNLNVMNFIKSDFVTINERLARFYGIPGVKGDHIRRVAVPPNVHRGGLMTQSSILTITSNGTRTSPVWRGVWILENILGDPPPPPPPDAGDIQPKVPGIDKATVRNRLEIHREIPACASCHNKIDPLGFALENYQTDGGWRDKEGFGYKGRVQRNDPDINASGSMPDGREFNGVKELQDILLNEEDRFLKCLTEKLVTYSLGRGVEFTDRPWIEQLIRNMKSNNYTLRSLIKDIVRSDQFRSK